VEPSSQDIEADIESLSIVQKSPASIVHNSNEVAFTPTSSSSSDFRNGELLKSVPSIEQTLTRNIADVSLPHGDNSAIIEPHSKEETESSQTSKSFDICLQTSGGGVKLKPSLREINIEKRRSSSGCQGTVLRPGMVLLRNYISCDEQIKIVKKCRELGLGEGGFYQPGYRDGAEMHLKMMCLGKNWDPETGNYVDLRAVDQAKPPAIPLEFSQLVERIINDSHEHLRKHENVKNVEKVLPSMTPDLCIVNFYAKAGRLGLHQDKDESKESILKGLPVVSISIGDTAEFCYGDFRDVENVKKVELKSGDVLVFGGKSRDIYHGVRKIEEKTASVALLQESKLRPGRLNLTFREY
jgi:DNA alkylation damage repair protein AlkB